MWILRFESFISLEKFIEEFFNFISCFVEIFSDTVASRFSVLIIRHLLVVWQATHSVSKLFLVPLGEFMFIFLLDRQKLDTVSLAHLKPLAIVGHSEDRELSWIPVLCINLLEVSLSDL